ncbi:MAG: DUF4426 domain-containing protein [Gammaproteobacteria bacterium]|nr:DUF4426 domain-containing protein [Gammaproteobacteria bacterium]
MLQTTTHSLAKATAGKRLTPSFILFLLVFLALSVSPTGVWAGTSQTFGDYTIYYSAFTSDTLQPAIAKSYGITRSQNLGLLSVSVVKKSLSPLGTPVKAKVKAEATNLTGQLKTVEIREVADGAAVYYLSEIYVSHKEVLDFTLYVTPEGETSPFVVQFRQQFYTK